MSRIGRDKRPSLSYSANTMDLIATTDALAAACARLAKFPFVTVDTEFLRETTYYAKLCLIQMASPAEAVLVDPLAEDMDLAPFYALMADTNVVKVFHSARQDIEIIWQGGGVIPTPLFDTQVAAMECGYGDSVSYEQLVNDLAKARIDKSSRFTDWSRRPLSEQQLAYALSDVTHLRTVYAALHADLADSGRESWLDEEMAVLTAPATYDTHPEDAWQRLRGRIKKPKEALVLMEIAAWREREARSRDVPRSRIMKDDALIDIAVHAPTTPEALGALRSLPFLTAVFTIEVNLVEAMLVESRGFGAALAFTAFACLRAPELRAGPASQPDSAILRRLRKPPAGRDG